MKLTELLVFCIGFFTSAASLAGGSSISSVPNTRGDEQKYQHPDQRQPSKIREPEIIRDDPQPQSQDCKRGPRAISITNQTNYPIYYDLSPDANGNGKRLQDWRIMPGVTWNHCVYGTMVIDFDYLLSKAGVQIKSYRVQLGRTYELIETEQDVIDLRGN